MANATMVRRGIELLPDESVKISPSKARLVQRAVAKSRARVLLPFTKGEKLKGEEGSMNRLSETLFLKDRIAQHNSGGKHLELHEAVCLGYQYGYGVVYGCYSTPFLIENAMRSVNSQWGLHLGFDTTFGMSNKNFELMGICANSLGRKSNPICLAFVNKESAFAYEKMYTAMQGGVFQLAHNLKLCRSSALCEMCNSVREQIEQGPMRELLTPPMTRKGQAAKPFKFKLPLEKPLCDNTTKFSKFIEKMFPHLSEDILVCAAHLTGIAWQKRSHVKYFDSFDVYKEWYKLLVRCLTCPSKALANILQMKLVEWLKSREEDNAAEWFEEYWCGKRGNWTIAHGGIAGTNNNSGTEGGWGGMKKDVVSTAGSTNALPVGTIVPSTVRYITNKSKEQASFWKKTQRSAPLAAPTPFHLYLGRRGKFGSTWTICTQ